MVIFHSYVKLPEGSKWVSSPQLQVDLPYLSHVNHWGYKPLTKWDETPSKVPT